MCVEEERSEYRTWWNSLNKRVSSANVAKIKELFLKEYEKEPIT